MSETHGARWTAALALSAGVAAAGPASPPSHPVGGKPAVAVPQLARFYGARWSVAEAGGGQLSHPRFTLVLHADGRRASLMGVNLVLQYPPPGGIGAWGWLHRLDVEDLLDPLLRPSVRLRGRAVRSVVLDPGHGGRDGGAVGVGGRLEKHLTLEVARRARTMLIAAGFEVYLTREMDEFLSLEDRTARAAARGADVFISIHFNAGSGAEAHGIETYIPARGGSNSDGRNGPLADHAVLGFLLQRHAVRQTGAVDRGLRRASFAVLRSAPCPAALLEGGFLTHPEEAPRLGDAKYQDRLAAAIAAAIVDYAIAQRRARIARAGLP